MKLLSKMLIIIFAIFLSSFQHVLAQVETSTEKTLTAQVNKNASRYEEKDLSVNLANFEYGDSYEQYKGSSNGTIFSFLGRPLGYFSVSSVAPVQCSSYKDEITGKMRGGCEQLDGDFTVDLPYFPNGKYANIYDGKSQKVFSLDLTAKATCNEDGACDSPKEDNINCPSDCKDDAKNSLKGEVYIPTAEAIAANQPSGIMAKIVLAIVLIFGAAGGYVWWKRKNSQKYY